MFIYRLEDLVFVEVPEFKRILVETNHHVTGLHASIRMLARKQPKAVFPTQPDDVSRLELGYGHSNTFPSSAGRGRSTLATTTWCGSPVSFMHPFASRTAAANVPYFPQMIS